MGLTIHYSLQAEDLTLEHAGELLEQLKSRALEIGFRCSSMFNLPMEDGFHGERYTSLDDEHFVTVRPTRGLFFVANPGGGCDSVALGLAQYPEQVQHDDRTIETQLTGWSWQAFCKTQFASNPREGGNDNFLRCHLGVIALLDRAQELGILSSVTDEGNYWQDRDQAALLREVEKLNRIVAAVSGIFKDKLSDVQSPMFDYPNFEPLEARGKRDIEERES